MPLLRSRPRAEAPVDTAEEPEPLRVTAGQRGFCLLSPDGVRRYASCLQVLERIRPRDLPPGAQGFKEEHLQIVARGWPELSVVERGLKESTVPEADAAQQILKLAGPAVPVAVSAIVAQDATVTSAAASSSSSAPSPRPSTLTLGLSAVGRPSPPAPLQIGRRSARSSHVGSLLASTSCSGTPRSSIHKRPPPLSTGLTKVLDAMDLMPKQPVVEARPVAAAEAAAAPPTECGVGSSQQAQPRDASRQDRGKALLRGEFNFV